MTVYDPKKTYVPILKSKTGELSALGELKEATKPNVIPLLEIPRPQWDFVNEVPTETTEKLIRRVVPYIQRHWDSRLFFLDMYGNPLVEQDIDDKQLADDLKKELDGTELKFIPVISMDYSLTYNQQIVENFQPLGRGFALRVTFNPEDVINEDDYEKLLSDLALSPADIDLILDLGSVSGDTTETVYLASRLVLAETPRIKEWRNLILSSSSFPKAAGSVVGANSFKTIERSEWGAWQKLASLPKLTRLPIFSDYAVAHPEVFDGVDPRHMKISGSIRYTTENDWLIIKGERLIGKNARGFKQFHDLAKKLTESEHYRGKEASSGDEYISECASPEEEGKGTGSLTTWRKVGNNQHIEYVTRQLAKKFETS